MNRIHRITAIVAGFAGVLLAVTATGPAAFAAMVPANGGATGVTPAPRAPVRIDTVGMAGWQITLIALAAALFAAAAAVFIDRIRTARPGVPTTSA
jgi:drug/metabolite transporter (DMT)-like permease